MLTGYPPMVLLTRRAFLISLGSSALGLFAAACSAPASAPSPTPLPMARPPAATPSAAGSTAATGTPAQAAQPAGAFTPLITNSELVVGKNRITLALLDPQNQPITDAAVNLEFFQLSGNQATKQGEAKAQFHYVDQPTKGVYAAWFTFPAAGNWGVQVTAQRPSQPARQARTDLNVLAKGAAPMIGTPAPKSKNPILSDVGGDASKLCTNTPPCDLHNLRIADAIAAGKPTVVLFATPGYCTSRTCAPELGVVLQLRDRYPEQASFIHIEIYKDPQNRVVADTVNEWGLQSEPWVFLVDRSGVISERYEGAAALDELEAGLKPLL